MSVPVAQGGSKECSTQDKKQTKKKRCADWWEVWRTLPSAVKQIFTVGAQGLELQLRVRLTARESPQTVSWLKFHTQRTVMLMRAGRKYVEK